MLSPFYRFEYTKTMSRLLQFVQRPSSIDAWGAPQELLVLALKSSPPYETLDYAQNGAYLVIKALARKDESED